MHAACQIAQDSHFVHRSQLHNRLGINLIVQLRVLNKSVLILYDCKDLSFVKIFKLIFHIKIDFCPGGGGGYSLIRA